MSENAAIVPLEAAAGRALGGKAEGLARMIGGGLRVPPGFVLARADRGWDREAVVAAWRALGAPRVAVRSSASGEDGAGASFAGQYETVLDVASEEGLVAAVERCVASAASERVRRYAAAREDEEHAAHSGELAVVVQAMIAPRAAGVLFTLDPASGRRDRMVVDAVRGLGEALVSGAETPDHYELDAGGRPCARDLAGDAAILGDEELLELAEGAHRATRLLGAAADLEWAIDGDGTLWWLQLRPVTAAAPDPRELDCAPPDPRDVLTRANIGEMMPGAVTPLGWSVTGYGIEHAMQAMQIAVGLQQRQVPEMRFTHMSCGHFLLNLTTMVEMSAAVLGSTREALCISICGRDVPELAEPPRRPTWRRALGGLRYFRYALTAPRRIARFEPVGRGLEVTEAHDARRLWKEIDRKLAVLWECYDVHLASSTGSGLVAGILERSLGDRPADERASVVAELLGGAGDVESAAVASAASDIAQALVADDELSRAFLALADKQRVQWLTSEASGAGGRAFRRVLARHGHRSLRELELRQRPWRDDPAPLVAAVSAAVRVGTSVGATRPAMPSAAAAAARYGVSPRVVAWGRDAVRRREHTKSLLVRVTGVFKTAYRRLGELLAAEGLLGDADLVFFLTHQELGRFLCEGERGLAARAEGRRRGLDWQMDLEFPEVSVGLPDPVEHHAAIAEGERVLQGRVVSRGRIEGLARVVRTLEEASAVRPGEILVAPVTDVGWTPYFATIAGLATDIGSAVSHGAVVAREYGLPAVVNLRTATRMFRTGDRVVLDADAGTLRAADDQG